MNRLEALRELAAKVEAGEANNMRDHTACYRRDNDGIIFALSWKDSASMNAYHGSLDAAKALHDAVLPGWFVRSFTQRGHDIWHAAIWPELSIVGREDMVIGKSATPSRAWLLAILRALIAQEESE